MGSVRFHHYQGIAQNVNKATRKHLQKYWIQTRVKQKKQTEVPKSRKEGHLTKTHTHTQIIQKKNHEMFTEKGAK